MEKKPGRDDLQHLLSMKDNELQSLIYRITEAVGADPQKAAALAGDLPGLREKLSTLSENDLRHIVSRAGAEKTDEALRILREKH